MLCFGDLLWIIQFVIRGQLLRLFLCERNEKLNSVKLTMIQTDIYNLTNLKPVTATY